MNLYKELHNDKYYNEVFDKALLENKGFCFDVSNEDLVNGILNYRWSVPVVKTLPKPNGKVREVYSFPVLDLTYHKIINSILSNNVSISDCVYSYRTGIRTSNAVKRIQNFVAKGYTFIKMDISNYFLSIPQRVIYRAIDSICSDVEGRLILKSLYNTSDSDGNYLALMPGCAVSSFFANYILRDLDTILEEECCCYARYSDDLLLIVDPNKEQLVLDLVISELSKLGLTLNKNKLYIYNNPSEVEFLGLKFTHDKISIGDKTAKEFKRNVKHICKIGKSLKSRISKLNKYLYNLSDISDKYGSIMYYIFSNVTNTQDIVELDYYIKDTLRASVTGRYKKSNSVLVPTSMLVDNGYRETMDYFNMFRINPMLYKTEVNKLLNSKSAIRFDRDIRDVVGNVEIQYFLNYFLKTLVSPNPKMIVNDEVVRLCDLSIDVENNTISAGDNLVYNNGLFSNKLKIYVNDEIYNVTFKELGKSIVDDNIMKSLLLNACVKTSPALIPNGDKIVRYRDVVLIKQYPNLVVKGSDEVRVSRFLVCAMLFTGWEEIKDFKFIAVGTLFFLVKKGMRRIEF